MNNQLRLLYQQLKEGKISREDALQQFKILEIQPNPKLKSSGHENTFPTPTERKPVPIVAQDLLEERAINYFTKLLSSVVRLPLHRIEADAPLEKYGIDSLMVMQLTNQLEKTFGSLSKTLFFEYQTIRELTGYFVESYRDQLIETLGIDTKPAVTGKNDSVVMNEPVPSDFSHGHPRFVSPRSPSPEKKITGALDIAIIGVSGRYPGAQNIREFWRNLRDGKDCITEIPKDRWDYSLYFDEDKNKPGKTYSKWGGFLEGVDQFDPLFFNISPMEAEIMDPQERLFLECVYETLEDAGYTRNLVGQGDNNVGVYVGVMYEEYQLYGAQEQIQGRPLALTGNPSSIANRVSYFCNFHGPSLAIDTMCSSSLMAIHLACQNLRQGGCELAIAGGVNVSIHPNKYLMLAQGKFASSKGRCESFGEGGDGYVPGEGVGAVLLKPLDKAVADGDHIYGVIKGTAVNHGGKTNGYSVPNPNAQAGVIGQALKEAGINPRTISYIEAHGTGTSLGDPIEITGLMKAFREYTGENRFCAIGSAKSNIGHCESAAGIAGVTKVLLQLENGQLVPSLHSEVLNSNIDFGNTPFTVQQTLTEWKRPVIDDLELPRRAGVSSFGAGGSNAHIVIEEYIPNEPEVSQISVERAVLQHAIIVISAKNEERLREMARRLLAAINERQFSDANLTNSYLANSQLADIAYTLQVGRESMDERLGMVVGSLKELGEKLQSFIENRDDIADIFRGQIKGNKEALNVFTADDEMREAVDKWIQRKKYGKLLELWVKGLVFDWNKLYGDIKPRRISLPVYPFARECYWVPKSSTEHSSITNFTTKAAYSQALHPLLHRNTSDINGLQFSSTFTGKEFFLKDHRVKGQRVLPGAASLEMAQAAVTMALGATAAAMLTNGQGTIRLKNIVWNQPLIVQEKPIQVHIGLFPEDNDEVAYEIYSSPHECAVPSDHGVPREWGATDTDDTEPFIHSQGSAILATVGEIPTLDLKDIQARCNQRIISAPQIYETFKAREIEYGLGYQGIETIYTGPDQILAKLSLPAELSDTEDRFILHPSLLDSALQASIIFMISSNELKTPSPAALQELEVFGRCTPIMWALVRYSEGNEAKFDIDLCDEQGTIRVRMKGYGLQILEAEANLVKSPLLDRLLFQVDWKEQAIAREASTWDYNQYLVILGEMGDVYTPERIRENLDAPQNGVRCLVLQSKRKSIDKRFQDYIIRVFDEIQTIFTEKPTDKVLFQIVIPNQGEGRLLSGLLGLLKTARLENPKMIGQLIEVEPGEGIAEIAAKVKENRHCPDIHIRYQDGKRWIPGWDEMNTALDETVEAVNLPWKDGGIYLITGGAGGLGLIFAKEIAGRTKNTVLVLTGRSLLGVDKQAQVKDLEATGARIIYKQVDVTDKKAVVDLIQSIGEEFGGLHGIIHSAGVIRDNYIVKKTKDELLNVLAPKVTGLVNLDAACQDLDLDFFILFSSIAGSLGNPGQADYSAANAFMDAYAGYRNSLVALNRRRGRTLTINWPLWKEGGMRSDQESEQLMAQTSGLVAMETRTGIRALYQGVVSGKDQVMVLEGDLKNLRAMLLGIKAGLKTANISSSDGVHSHAHGRRPEMKGLSLEQCLEWDLKQFISRLLKIARDRIDRDKNLAEFGFNSIGLTQFAIQLIKHYRIEEITPALFFRYSSIEKLIQYFLAEHQAVIQEFYREDPGGTERIKPAIRPIVPMVQIPSKRQTIRRLRASGFTAGSISQSEAEPIAIIGMSGRFPGARNIEELWTILATGQNMVQEIPTERFDWRQYYGDPGLEPGKINSKWCGCIPGVSEFEPLFFEISPKEAEITDPRQRLLLEESWKALEDAGYGAEQINAHKIGMFVGVEQGDYQFLIKRGGSVTSNNNAILASRLAYFLNLNGPVMAIDTACSSGLVAAHQAILSLRNNECDTAIAAGVNLLLTPVPYVVMSQAGMLSEDGKCYAFDKRASGMVPGEAVAVVVLKRLSQAEGDGDPIYAVIKGSGINYDGKTNGITAPNGVSQTNLLKAVYDQYQINPEDIGYIVTHGTGTRLGDPVEINALCDAFKDYTTKQSYCALTSTKTNFGHTFGASGLVSLISLVQALQHETIPASLHCEQENDYINWKESPFYVNKTNRPWPAGNSKTRTNNTREAGDAGIRMGAVSAFGMSGTNAHMVVQSYEKDNMTLKHAYKEQVPYYILALSAKTPESLAEKIKDLIKVLENKAINTPDLSQICYTLLNGRQHFHFRVAIVIQDREDAIYVLKQVDGREKLPNLFRGKVPRDFMAQKVIEQYTQDLLNTVRTSLENRDRYREILYALADLYCQGYDLDWQQLFGDVKLPRVHLPTYPFARENYWTPETDTKSGDMASSPAVAAYIHPLLHRNTSDFSEQRFSSTFTGEEFFIKDNVVKGQRVLPGSVSLEMARAAVIATFDAVVAGPLKESPAGMRLMNVVWNQPIIIGEQPVRIHIRLYPEHDSFFEGSAIQEDDGDIAYEIYTLPDECGVMETQDVEPVIYSQGCVTLNSTFKPLTWNLKAIQAQCTQRTFAATEIYETFKAAGIEYGPEYQGVEEVYMGQDQVLAKFAVSDTQNQYVLHPGIIDLALQVSIVLMNNSGVPKPLAPLALQELEIFGKCPAAGWVLIRYSEEESSGHAKQAGKAGDKLPKFDIEIGDDQGTVWVRLKGMETREIAETMIGTSSGTNLPVASPSIQEAYEIMTFEELWQEEALPDEDPRIDYRVKPKTLVCFLSNPENQQAVLKTVLEAIQTPDQQIHLNATIVFISQSTVYQKESPQKYSISGTDRNSYEKVFRSVLEDYREVDAILYLWPLEDPGCIQDYSHAVYILQAIAAVKLKTKRVLFAAQFENRLERCYLESWIGFERSLKLILPNTQVATIYQAVHQEVFQEVFQEVSKPTPETGMTRVLVRDWLRKLGAELQTPQAESVWYQEGKRYVCRIQPTIIPSGKSLLKPGGTYLITGGCGGLGLLFAHYLTKLSSVADPVKLILTGRSPIDAEKQSKIKALEDSGSQVMYVQADVCDSISMKEALDQARERFGSLNGVIHAAGIEGKQNIFAKELHDFQQVLAPKVKGTLVLDELLKAEPLEFVCYFSSSAAILGDFGSCDYAIGNRFLMAYAGYRNQLQLNGERQGKTMVINWPLWKEGSMGFGDDQNTKMYLKSSGQRILETEEGLAIFERILAHDSIQHLVIAGQPSRVQRFLGLIKEQPVTAAFVISDSTHNAPGKVRGRRPEIKGLNVEQCLEWDLKEQISRLLKISRDKIERDENLADFGFDSLRLAELASLLSNHYGIEVTPAMFFGYSTIEKLTQYYLSEYPEAVKEFYREDANTDECIAQESSAKVPDAETKLKRRLKKSRFVAGSVAPHITEPIAIIGMSGRFPGARNIDELWTNLVTGQDRIQEIPMDRFDWRQYYGDPHKEQGKMNSKWCGCIPGVSEFEPLFFEISPIEAETMDPRQRLLLQESWKALEDAGYGAEQIKHEKIGMFVGAEQGDYQLLVKGEGSITSNHNAILASRLAYYLNLSGPVMAIDTACSSGLVAAHQATLSLRNEECDTAIAAGVNLMLTPAPYLGMSQAGMLSEDGKCYAFDKRANGLVPGEAVAVVVLKRLSRAEADGDPIYAVIRGSGINYDGRTNGITAPSGISQTNLLKTVYNQYRVNPEDIGYIVTHGTGTKLGDPVEINALYDAFKDYTRKQGYCALTSTKPNFGHTFAASGIVSLISLVQALRHGTIPASLHCEQENDYINWKESPFYVNKTNQSWSTGDGKSRTGAGITRTGAGITRTGAVSAFGMSGTNAHMVVQNYSAAEKGVFRDQAPYYLLVFSAKTGESLQEKIVDMLEMLQNKDIQAQDLSQISYTLLEGRQHFNHRCAIVIQDREDALYVLKQMDSREKMPNLFQGKVPRDFKGQKAIERYIDELLDLSRTAQESKNSYQEILYALAEFYCQGYLLDWKQLYGAVKPNRIHLPTYPFTRECYWVSENNTKSDSITSNPDLADFAGCRALHPLLHQNTSDFSEQRFSSVFTGQEFFLADHVVKGRRILSGAVYLEMARAAMEAAAGFLATDQTGICLKNVVWTQPIVIESKPVQVHIGLFPESNGEIAYEIYSSPHEWGVPDGCEPAGTDEGERIVHSQGSAVFISGATVARELSLSIDLKALQAQCDQRTLSSAELYEIFKMMEIDYGPGYQAIETVYVGQDQVLAKLALPSAVSHTQAQFDLHPSMMDSALQASIGLMMNSGNRNPLLPFALQELEIFSSCTSTMWALIRNSEDTLAGRQVWKFDIDLCDETGTVCVQMKGLEMQEATSASIVSIAETQEAYELMTFEEIWQEEALSDKDTSPVSQFKPKTLVCFLSNPENQQVFIDSIRIDEQQTHVTTEIIFVSQGTVYQKQSRQKYDISRTDRNTYQRAFQSIREDTGEYSRDGEVDAILYLWPLEDSSCTEDYACMAYMLQTLVSAKLKAKRIILAAQFANGLERCYQESWIGFERSLGLVLPNTEVTVICQAAHGLNQETMRLWARKLWMELQVPKAQSVVYQDGKRYVCQIRPTTIPFGEPSGKSPLKPGGTYLITGGCGGLGLLFAEHLTNGPGAVKPVNLILTGRSPLDAKKQSKIKALEDLGSQVLYVQADVCDRISMKEGLNRAQERFGAIHGIIHAAGIEGTQIILTKEIQSFQMVLDPKVKGTLVLDELLKAEPLDFVCYFSSSAAILGDFGSCDYAIANRFLMAYARYRNQQRKGQLPGKTIVINWPLWKDGGMGFSDDESTKMYLKSSGQRILETGEGLTVFDRILAQNNTQYLVLAGQPSRVYRFLGLAKEQPATTAPDISVSSHIAPHKSRGRVPGMKGLSMEQCLEWDLKEQISQLLKISRDKLDRDENLADFGFDSIRLAQLANVLTGHYGIEITPALFFGYATIAKLSQYFLTEHQEAILEFYREDAVKPDISPMISIVGNRPKRPIRLSRFVMGNVTSNIPESIAIIGMSGRFPEARNIDELWATLVTGRDVVQEIPVERFDWRKYNAPERGGSGISFKCGCISGVDEFEPLFFEISPKEATTMDPRQRLLLQEAWKALEDAGYGAEQLKTQKIGMFVGVEQGDYQLLVKGEGGITSNNNSILASRLAYFLNLSGPVMAIDTACSSGLVAAHQAILSLRNGECNTAIAAGVNLLLTPAPYLGMSQAGMLSEEGKCYAFDKRANGMVPGEAVAVVVLKRLSQAEADGDPIYAVIKGSGINYDGKTNGITAPNGVSQTNLLKAIYDQYRVNPEEIEYIVTHGTGTKLGDPVEINALYDAFKDYTKKQGYCAITSNKTNFGHTFAASGLVSLISLVQALRYETIPASLHCEQENDYINWKESPFYVNKTNRPWPSAVSGGVSTRTGAGITRTGAGITRTGAVSAFGMSGTNAHMVVQSYVAAKKGVFRDQAPYYLLVFSAKTEESLAEKIRDMIEMLQNKDIQEQDLSQMSYTLLEGRQHFNYRCAIVIQDREDAVYVLNQAGGPEKLPNLFQGKVPRNFTGQKVIERYAQDLLNIIRTSRESRNKYQEILYALADLYCQGYEMDWKQLFGDLKPQRIHLPAYPFIRERYWIEETNQPIDANSLTHPNNGQFDDTFYNQLIDELMNDTISTDVAVRKTKELETR